MAIDTGSVPGEQQSVFARAPDFPSNIGKIDVGAIYDRVAQGLANSENIAKNATGALGAANDLQTQLATGSAQRSLIPAETQAAAAKAGQTTAESNLAASRAGFLASLPAAARQAGVGVVGQNDVTSRVYDTSDPKNPRLVDTTDSFVNDPTTGQPVKVKSTSQSVFSPRDIQVFKAHTDQNGNIIATDGTYRQIDLSKPAFQVDKEGNLDVIRDASGQPVNAALVAATGKAERGTPISSGVGGDEQRINTFEQLKGEHPEQSAFYDQEISRIKADMAARTGATSSKGLLSAAQAGAVGAPKPGTPEADQSKIESLSDEVAAALKEGNTDYAKTLTDSIAALAKIRDARTQGISKQKPVSGLAALAGAPQSASSATAPAAAGQPPSIAAGDTAAYNALPPGATYTVPGYPKPFIKAQAPTAAAGPTDQSTSAAPAP
jgi:hypothetical protein